MFSEEISIVSSLCPEFSSVMFVLLLGSDDSYNLVLGRFGVGFQVRSGFQP